jgi:hypothetical protein
VKPPRLDTRAFSPAGMFGGKAPLRLAVQKSRQHAPSAPPPPLEAKRARPCTHHARRSLKIRFSPGANYAEPPLGVDFLVNSKLHTGANSSVRLCVGLIRKLYYFLKEKGGCEVLFACLSECLAPWPPYKVGTSLYGKSRLY